ncbi:MULTISPECIES: DNA polymerase/3'-5' exonuclease PolX [Bacillaceae]|uniref:DNA-directed DNA polymerase n=1 Tax=Peribacillus simplex TaxID=1478 RepID=A0AAN2PK98_9BACI|nr:MULTISPECIES: DNA polymerase/3'-5' exonuclease PolX [Bacillaceae]MCF7623808.1 DNA polymerase/3'-5' exonuclease PolX [Peribacillus frigoritolerans]MCP1154353.1 DNA polymerase/3'-5' exonuclease PolX [Peribacillus frigoritolerans]MCT1390825.1 DNA polymerase/3'-5' exonuclease PolX [Peribacillus frigoritolerans]NCT37200.1 DNA polymerase/3'-5' exonuclease PolX [Peribacillus frigoritolerans]PRA95559.1 DNA polymerase/3'-5' exonuclease PolX [Peribacillus simplex]
MTINKKDIIKLLEKIAIYMELKGENPFKVSAFRKAAGALETDDRSLTEIEDFTALNGIGKGTASVIDEYINEGKSTVLEELQEQVPKGLIPLLQLQGLGGKKIAKLHKELHVKDVNDLKIACEEGRVAALAGFGKKTEEKILSAIAEAGSRPDRLPLAFMMPIAADIETVLANMDYIIRSSRAGSIRRMRETIKDLDFIISTDHPEEVKNQLLAIKGIKQVIAAGDTKVSVVLDYEYDISVDFRIVKDKEFITTLHHFTGSKDHNVRMRQLAKDRGEKISEYGVEVTETGDVLTFETEEQFYNHFGLPFIPPEIREDGTEVEHYDAKQPLISLEAIKGDLHMHTTWSDGAHTIEEMIEACRAKGYRYMAITDHSQYLKVANGLTAERLREQKRIIHELNEKYTDFTVLSGIEMDILPDGTLDYDDELLAEMDLVIASIHSSFSQPRETIMERLKTALNNPHVDIIAHPTGRIIGRRTGYDVDIEMLIELARETNTALELNANPNRLDLAPPHLRKAQEAGVPIVINTDAHSIDMLEHMPVGVSSAKKGWIKESTVLNARDTDGLLAFLKRND